MGWATLKSITAQQHFDDFVVADRDLTDVPLVDIWDDSTIDTFTQEINVLGSGDRLDWVLGAFYLREEWDRHIVFNNALPVFGFPVPSQSSSRNRSWTRTPCPGSSTRPGSSPTVRVSAQACAAREDEIDEYHVNQGVLPLFNVTNPVLRQGRATGLGCDDNQGGRSVRRQRQRQRLCLLYGRLQGERGRPGRMQYVPYEPKRSMPTSWVTRRRSPVAPR